MLRPTKFGKYLLLERIAVGGMAEVFVAKAFGVEGFERLLAIKKILPTRGEDSEFISMFVDEARIAVQLAHANIVQVLELGKHDDSLYIAMEYISGRDLRQVMERLRKMGQAMPIPQACLIVARMCEALDHAHRKRDASGRPLGIVHRDVSPQNVLVSFEGEVKLIDFGIAKAESRLQKTQAGILKGKFSYMSPEQVKGQPVDGRTDLFAAGILLWELVCGEKLFTGESDFAILDKVRKGVVPAPRSLRKDCPEGLEKVIQKALAVDPAQRHQTASELHDDLVRFTLSGDALCGSRQLAQWLRAEFAEDWEKEQARLRGWLAEGEQKGEITPPGAHRRGSLPRDADTLAAPPTPPGGVLPARGVRYGGALLLLVAAAGALFAAAALGRQARPGKMVVTLSPSVPADLVLDGNPAGTLPPFVRTVDKGAHRIEVRAPGYKPFAAQVEVPGGGRLVEVGVQLVAEGPMQVEGVVLTQPRPEAASAHHRRP